MAVPARRSASDDRGVMLDAILDEFSRTGGPPLAVMALRLAGTALLCGLIGFEREVRKNTAGLRTNILVGVAAACFALITLSLIELHSIDDENVRVDPLRLVEAVTSGVAFLAAGIVFFDDNKVHGLTTGAGLWLAAAIGLACGLGFWSIALLAALVGLFVLTLLRRVQVRIGLKDPRDEADH